MEPVHAAGPAFRRCPAPGRRFAALSASEIGQEDLDAGEDVRILLLCDLTEGYAAGWPWGCFAFCGPGWGEIAPFLGLIGQVRASGRRRGEALAAARGALPP